MVIVDSLEVWNSKLRSWTKELKSNGQAWEKVWRRLCLWYLVWVWMILCAVCQSGVRERNASGGCQISVFATCRIARGKFKRLLHLEARFIEDLWKAAHCIDACQLYIELPCRNMIQSIWGVKTGKWCFLCNSLCQNGDYMLNLHSVPISLDGLSICLLQKFCIEIIRYLRIFFRPYKCAAANERSGLHVGRTTLI